MKKGLQYYIVLASIVVGFSVSLLNLIGALAAVPWLSARVPTFTLLVVSLVMGYLVIERGNKLDKIESLLRTAVEAADIHLFKTRRDFFESAERRIKKAEQIDVTHFGLSAPSKADVDSFKYYQTFAKVIQGGNIKVRRILILRNQSHVDWARQMLDAFADCPQFFLKVYKGPFDYIPMINLMIVDGTEVYLGGGERAPSDDPKALLVRDNDFTESIQEHFKTLWRDSIEVSNSDDLAQVVAKIHSLAERKL